MISPAQEALALQLERTRLKANLWDTRNEAARLQQQVNDLMQDLAEKNFALARLAEVLVGLEACPACHEHPSLHLMSCPLHDILEVIVWDY